MVLPDITYFQLSHTCEFTSINGNECLLQIYRRPVDYFWKVMEITGQSNPVTIEFGNTGGGIFDTLRTKTLIFNFYSETNNKYNEFFEGELYSYYCKFYINNILEFQGWMLPDIHTERFTTPPFELSVKFGCGLFLLKDNFVENPFTVGSPLKFIREALAFTAFNLNILDFVHIYEQSMLSLIGKEKLATLKQLFIGWEPLFEMSYYDALDKILQSFCCEMYQYKGEWLIKRNDVSTDEITGVRYSQSTGLIIDALDLHFNKDITVYSEAVADRLCWINGDQNIQFEPAYKELDLKIPKELTENFFVTGSDLNQDIEQVIPDIWYPYSILFKHFRIQKSLSDNSLRPVSRYLNYDFIETLSVVGGVEAFGCFSLLAHSWKYHTYQSEARLRLNINIKCGAYKSPPEQSLYDFWYKYSDDLIYIFSVSGYPFLVNNPISFNTSFGKIKANKIYYIREVSTSFSGLNLIKLSYNKNGFSPITNINDIDVDGRMNINPIFISKQIFLFKSFSLATQWSLGNDGNWYSFAATNNVYLTVDILMDIKQVKDTDGKFKVDEYEWASTGYFPDSGYLFYRSQGVNGDNIFYKSLKFTVVKDFNVLGAAVIEPFVDNLDSLTVINQSEKETYEHTITFTDTPTLLNPHLIYKNWLSCIDVRVKTDSWFLDFNYPVYKAHYQHIQDLITLQINKRKAILKGTITSLGDVIGYNLKEKNYFDLYFKNVYCNFNPKFETYNGEWVELKQPLVKSKIPYSEFDVDFNPVNYN